MSVRASFLFRLAGMAFRSGKAVAAANPRDAVVVAILYGCVIPEQYLSEYLYANPMSSDQHF
jgi:hypothetical protein